MRIRSFVGLCLSLKTLKCSFDFGGVSYEIEDCVIEIQGHSLQTMSLIWYN